MGASTLQPQQMGDLALNHNKEEEGLPTVSYVAATSGDTCHAGRHLGLGMCSEWETYTCVRGSSRGTLGDRQQVFPAIRLLSLLPFLSVDSAETSPWKFSWKILAEEPDTDCDLLSWRHLYSQEKVLGVKQEARETVRTFLERTHSWRDWVLACKEFLLFGFLRRWTQTWIWNGF